MVKKIFVILLILTSKSVAALSQVQNRIFLKGIEGGVIKLSQLTDTSVKLITTKEFPLKGHAATLYLTGTGYSQTVVVTISLNFCLAAIRNELRVGTSIIIDDFIYKNPKTGATTFFKGREYKIIAD